jgi:nucleoid-associated protein YgaU
MNDRRDPRHSLRLRGAAVWVAATAAAGALVRLLAPEIELAPAGRPFAGRLVWLCAVVGLAGVAWLWLLTTAVAVEAVTGAGTAPGVPAALRRLVLAACGMALVGTGPAVAAADRLPAAAHPDPHEPGAAAVVAGLPLPDRAEDAGALDEQVVVRSGDTLWALAERGLPPKADEAAVTARWHRIYDLNRDRIGPDPDLIQPGQRLRLPRP